ncbi:MAG TPA: NAD-dependent epimerase/dehydratase family protein [Jatrophihabitantaceae bacterium]|jgi:2'-hydroxyisoflavone reductase
MDVLVIGGSVFLGRAVVGEALALGASVTVFNRGKSGATPDGATALVGDRTVPADLEQLRGRHFDLVVDTCGYVPADVARSADLLATSCDRYVFVSSINAYPGWPEQTDYRAGGAHAGRPDATREDVPDGLDPGDAYGWLKVGCELAVQRAFGPDRCAVLRAGSIVGPYDSAVGRLPWWLHRVARGGDVLVPGAPGDPVALIDARDLARFALSAPVGTFEAGGPSTRDTRADLMAACVAATGGAATFSYVDESWLESQDVEPWTELPLWAPTSSAPGLFAHDGAAAEAAGLSWRPLADTVADTWAWQRAVPWQPTALTPGLAPERELALLAGWHTRPA